MNIKLIAIASLSIFLFACKPTEKNEIVIGVIEPIQHASLDEIVKGLTETLHENYHGTIKVKVENAQNDMNLQRAIIQKMRNAHYDFIIPIGLSATQMTLAMVKDIPVISLASDLSQENRKSYAAPLAIVHDQTSTQSFLKFIHAIYPNKKNLLLIHSASDKVFPEVEEMIKVGKNYGITIKPIMVNTLPDLYQVSQSLPNTEGILVLKDHLIVSGMSVLASTAAKKHIPLIASDEGSVINGASFALGVPEQQIGKEGAQLVISVLQGASVNELPIVNINDLTAFINVQSLTQQSQRVDTIVETTKKFHYQSKLYGVS